MIKIYSISFFLISLSLVSNSQISDSLYARIPDQLRPKDKTNLSFLNKIELLHNLLYADIVIHKTELSKIVESLHADFKKGDFATKIKVASALSCYYSKVYDFESDSVDSYAQYVLDHVGESQIQMFYKEYSEALSIQSLYFAFRGKLDTALSYLYFSRIVIRPDDTLSLFSYYSSYASVYTELGMEQEALKFKHAYLKLIDIKKYNINEYLGQLVSITQSHVLLYQESKMKIYRDSALCYLQKVEFLDTSKAKIWQPVSCYFKGRLDFIAQDYKSAINYFNLYDSSRVPGDDNYFFGTKQLVDAYRALSRVNLGDKTALSEIEQLHISTTMTSLKLQVSKSLYEYWSKASNWQKAFHYLESYKNMSDSINVEKNRVKLFEQDKKFQLVEKDARIKGLEIVNLKRKQMVGWGALIVFIVISSGLFYILFLKRRAKSLEIQKALQRSELLQLIQVKEDEWVHQIEQMAENNRAIEREFKGEIGRVLHDEIANGLAALRFYISDMRKQAETNKVLSLLESIQIETDAIYISVKQFLERLHAGKVEVAPNLFEFLSSLEIKFSGNTSIQLALKIDEASLSNDLNVTQLTQLYFILKEAIVNALKHSNCSAISISISTYNGFCDFEIADNGIGFDIHNLKRISGLNHMKLRTKKLDGTISLDRQIGGMTIKGRFPI